MPSNDIQESFGCYISFYWLQLTPILHVLLKQTVAQPLALEGSNSMHSPFSLVSSFALHTEEKALFCSSADIQLELCLILFQPLLKLATLKPELECVNLLGKWMLEPSRKQRGLSTFATTGYSSLLENPFFLGFHQSFPWALLLLWPELWPFLLSLLY